MTELLLSVRVPRAVMIQIIIVVLVIFGYGQVMP